MKITIIKKAEAKNTNDSRCPWVIEDFATNRRK